MLHIRDVYVNDKQITIAKSPTSCVVRTTGALHTYVATRTKLLVIAYGIGRRGKGKKKALKQSTDFSKADCKHNFTCVHYGGQKRSIRPAPALESFCSPLFYSPSPSPPHLPLPLFISTTHHHHLPRRPYPYSGSITPDRLPPPAQKASRQNSPARPSLASQKQTEKPGIKQHPSSPTAHKTLDKPTSPPPHPTKHPHRSARPPHKNRGNNT